MAGIVLTRSCMLPWGHARGSIESTCMPEAETPLHYSPVKFSISDSSYSGFLKGHELCMSLPTAASKKQFPSSCRKVPMPSSTVSSIIKCCGFVRCFFCGFFFSGRLLKSMLGFLSLHRAFCHQALQWGSFGPLLMKVVLCLTFLIHIWIPLSAQIICHIDFSLPFSLSRFFYHVKQN